MNDTERDEVDAAVRLLWAALDKLDSSDPAALTDIDVELWYVAARHPAIQKRPTDHLQVGA